MIRISKDKILKEYFIDENGVITDKNGVIQKFCLHHGRYIFKQQAVHKIMMYTFYEWRNGREWVIHHIDENKLNNKLNNLVYLTPSEHSKLHGQNMNENIKMKISNTLKGHIGHPSYGMLGKHHSEETKRKMSEAHKGEKNPMYGKSPKIKNKHLSLEVKEKIRTSLKAYWANKI